MSSLLGGQPGKSPRTRGCRASGKAAGRALRGGGALTPDSNSGSKARSCGQAQSPDVVSPTDSAKTAPADADIGQWSGRTRTSPLRGAVSTFSSWPAAGSPAPTGPGYRGPVSPLRHVRLSSLWSGERVDVSRRASVSPPDGHGTAGAVPAPVVQARQAGVASARSANERGGQ